MGKPPDYHTLTRARELDDLRDDEQERMREGLTGQVLDDRQEHDCSCGEPDPLDASTVIHGVAPATDASRERGLGPRHDMMLILL
ncbi:hypothetical protein IFM61606_09910 [Aspergillus udagawae]|nr:hypothetical protein IFM61606_09910 [Aspergillus udagawae]